uniref:Putative ixostatin n=1 Tax=Ixodes ricinus TaxID=34613 RepID=A0A0K8R8Z3_IXORI
MSKAIFIVMVTSQLLYYAVSQQLKWVDVEQEYGLHDCMINLGLQLDEECQKYGTIQMETVNFTDYDEVGR